MLGGLTATVIGSTFAFAALRVKGLYLALSTLALQFVMDWVISHVPAISGGIQATLQAPPMKLLGQAVTSEAGLYYVALGWCLLVTLFMLNLRRTALGRALVAVREKDFAAAVIGVHELPLQAGGVRDLVVHRRRQRRDADLRLLSRGHARAVRGQRLDRTAGDGDRRRPRQHHRQLLRRRPSSC